MPRFISIATTAVVLAFAAAPTAEEMPLRIGVENPENYDHLVSAYGDGQCPDIDTYEYPIALGPRLWGDLLILCHALRLGGYDGPFEHILVPNYNRALADAIVGRIDIPMQTVWSTELEEHADSLAASAPVIRSGEWVVGLFTTENRTDVLATRTEADLSQLAAAVPRGWVEDWSALSALDLRDLIDVQTSTLILDMIASGSADFTLRQFGDDPDLGLYYEPIGMRLVPIPGLKLGFEASRHYAVWRGRADADAIVAAIDAGLAELRRNGGLAHVLEAVGIIEPRVADWTQIGPAAK